MQIVGLIIANFGIIGILSIGFFAYIFVKDYLKNTFTRIAVAIGYLFFNILPIYFWYKWFSIFSLIGILIILGFFVLSFFVSILDEN